MKSELKLDQHSVLKGQNVAEIWHDGKFIGQVCGADGAGVRVISKYPLQVRQVNDSSLSMMTTVIEIGIFP